jgi:hypothetical protein
MLFRGNCESADLQIFIFAPQYVMYAGMSDTVQKHIFIGKSFEVNIYLLFLIMRFILQ